MFVSVPASTSTTPAISAEPRVAVMVLVSRFHLPHGQLPVCKQDTRPTRLHPYAAPSMAACEVASGAVNMEWRLVNLEQRYVTLPDTKNGTSREVPLSKRAVILLEKLAPQVGKVFKSKQESSSTEFRKAVKKCGIENLRFHDTCHEACTRLSKIYNVAQLAKVIGHNDLNSLQIYFNPTGAELAQLLDK